MVTSITIPRKVNTVNAHIHRASISRSLLSRGCAPGTWIRPVHPCYNNCGKQTILWMVPDGIPQKDFRVRTSSGPERLVAPLPRSTQYLIALDLKNQQPALKAPQSSSSIYSSFSVRLPHFSTNNSSSSFLGKFEIAAHPSGQRLYCVSFVGQ